MRRNRNSKLYKLILPMNIATLCILVLVIGIWVSAGLNIFTTVEDTTVEDVTFNRCIDGDTAHFNINGEDEAVRFIAIDTPETVKPNTPVEPFGKKASDYTCNLLTNAENIKLEYEESNKSDKYGRKIAWVWVDGNLLQLELVKEGFAKVAFIYGDYKYTNQIKEAEILAKDKRLGIWN